MWNPIQKIRDFYNATMTELRKCTWPTWHELGESTILVIVSAALISIFVFVVDAVVTTVIRFVT
ncbi:MAG: preprotein translocase subunit SecE [Candidatus Pacebacteria bacterium]|nr:preprotein translocase subunit SecE [Candidatus Paceibacterota bacterium]